MTFGFHKRKNRMIVSSPTPVVLATTSHTATSISDQMLTSIEKQLGYGWITNFFILCAGKKPSIKELLVRKLTNAGHAWAAKRVVYQLKDENPREFLTRIFNDCGVTHFAAIRKDTIKFVVEEPYLSQVRVFQCKVRGRKAWDKAKNWLFKTSPKRTGIIHKAADSFVIIRTGVTMEKEQKTVKKT